jgi:hypothetical protein
MGRTLSMGAIGIPTDASNVDAEAVKCDSSQNEQSDKSSSDPFQGGHILISLLHMFAHV